MVHFAENAELHSIYLAQRLKLKQLGNRQGDVKENEYLLLKMVPCPLISLLSHWIRTSVGTFPRNALLSAHRDIMEAM